MIKFEDKMNRLDEIVSMLEKNQASLDDAIKLFEEGLHLADDLDAQLKVYENKEINELTLVKDEKNV